MNDINWKKRERERKGEIERKKKRKKGKRRENGDIERRYRKAKGKIKWKKER